MYFRCKWGCTTSFIVAGLIAWAVAPRPVYAQGASRALPVHYGPGASLTVSIAIDPPPGTGIVILEDAPPAGWSASNISHGGTWDVQNEKVKWGPFWDPSIPATVTYDATPATQAIGQQCFAGTVSFDVTGNQPVAGDPCIAVAVPTLSQWGLVVMLLLLLAAGTLVLRRLPIAGRRDGRSGESVS